MYFQACIFMFVCIVPLSWQGAQKFIKIFHQADILGLLVKFTNLN